MRLLVPLVLGLFLLGFRLSDCSFSSLKRQAADFLASDDHFQYVWLSGHNIESGLYNLPKSSIFPASDDFAALYDPFGLIPPKSERNWISPVEYSIINEGELVSGLYLENRRFPESTAVPARLAQLFFQPVPINRANKEVLCTIPGVGPQIVKRIIALRKKKGGFLSPSDLQLISGIGKAKSNRLKKYVSFE